VPISFHLVDTYVKVGFCKIDIIGDNGANFSGLMNVFCNDMITWKGLCGNLC
jgi:hypothetical protein